MVKNLKKTLLSRSSKKQNPLYYKNQAKKLGPFRKMTERDLVDLESSLGATIFGEVPNGYTRKFFNVDKDTWIWHEEWIDGNKNLSETTIRYEILKNKVIKIEPGPRYTEISGRELDNFIQAVNQYNSLIINKIYKNN